MQDSWTVLVRGKTRTFASQEAHDAYLAGRRDWPVAPRGDPLSKSPAETAAMIGYHDEAEWQADHRNDADADMSLADPELASYGDE